MKRALLHGDTGASSIDWASLSNIGRHHQHHQVSSPFVTTPFNTPYTKVMSRTTRKSKPKFKAGNKRQSQHLRHKNHNDGLYGKGETTTKGGSTTNASSKKKRKLGGGGGDPAGGEVEDSTMTTVTPGNVEGRNADGGIVGEDDEDGEDDTRASQSVGKRKRRKLGRDLANQEESEQVQDVDENDDEDGKTTDDSCPTSNHIRQDSSITAIKAPSSKKKTSKIPPNPTTTQEEDPSTLHLQSNALPTILPTLRKKYTVSSMIINQNSKVGAKVKSTVAFLGSTFSDSAGKGGLDGKGEEEDGMEEEVEEGKEEGKEEEKEKGKEKSQRVIIFTSHERAVGKLIAIVESVKEAISKQRYGGNKSKGGSGDEKGKRRVWQYNKIVGKTVTLEKTPLPWLLQLQDGKKPMMETTNINHDKEDASGPSSKKSPSHHLSKATNATSVSLALDSNATNDATTTQDHEEAKDEEEEDEEENTFENMPLPNSTSIFPSPSQPPAPENGIQRQTKPKIRVIPTLAVILVTGGAVPEVEREGFS